MGCTSDRIEKFHKKYDKPKKERSGKFTVTVNFVKIGDTYYKKGEKVDLTKEQQKIYNGSYC